MLEECNLHDTPAIDGTHNPERNGAASSDYHPTIITLRGRGVSQLGGVEDVVAGS